jgi:hypothetical protein
MGAVSSSRRAPVAGQLQVNVVEGGLAGGHGRGVDAQAGDGGDGVPSGVAGEGDGERRADGERVACGQAAGAHRGQRAVWILVHPQLDQLGAQPGQKRGRAV